MSSRAKVAPDALVSPAAISGASIGTLPAWCGTRTRCRDRRLGGLRLGHRRRRLADRRLGALGLDRLRLERRGLRRLARLDGAVVLGIVAMRLGALAVHAGPVDH